MQDALPESLPEYYAARAREYDTIYLKPERQDDLRAMEAWLPRQIGSGSVLEIACGTGYWTQFYAPHCSQVLAIDAAIETLEIARARVPLAQVQFTVGDAYQLPTCNDHFDAAFAGFWWSHVPITRQQVFLRGLHKALKPGARVVLIDNRYVEGSSTPISDRDTDGNTYQTRLLKDGSAHRVLKNFPTERQLREAAAPHASEIEVREWPYFWALSYRIS
ncbi:class I SAM-dependent methyltransferase [Diaphorobacter sp. HDW4A]|uniref:class I SAM-dependent methyltransferase n=1 Tax=Diaphorobacter sp. HDW4A TaxID=2714924 RepID=UPI00140BA094|nr:class I SAM-dependent methyltransferase [Diaphorobacter sp. HDW4A]QIL80051.1 class I SAM-dependent methyltransferase [Diaphorobacter sp. HDW4A]